jgi:hypothetical protein
VGSLLSFSGFCSNFIQGKEKRKKEKEKKGKKGKKSVSG